MSGTSAASAATFRFDLDDVPSTDVHVRPYAAPGAAARPAPEKPDPTNAEFVRYLWALAAARRAQIPMRLTSVSVNATQRVLEQAARAAWEGRTPALLLAVLSLIVDDWRAPLHTTGAWDEWVLEWWSAGARKLTLHVDDTAIEYVKVWGTDIDSEMEAGAVGVDETFVDLWAWLNET